MPPIAHVSCWTHANRDSYLPWELDNDGKERFPRAVHNGLHYLGYEVELLYTLDMQTGAIELVAAREGTDWLVKPGFELTEGKVREARDNGAT